MSEHLIVKLPEYWTSSESETMFNSLGFQGWDLRKIYNLHAYFVKDSPVPLSYKFVKVDAYINEFETILNDVGYDDWILVLTRNGYSVLKQIALE